MRTEGQRFAGGIQPGTTASSAASTGLEHALRTAANAVVLPGLVHRAGFSGTELAAAYGLDGVVLNGVYPDGGVWCAPDGTQPLLAAEAKHQGEAGNAIERWYKNYTMLNPLGVRVHLTVCTGAGFFEHRSPQRIIESVLATIPNERYRLTEDLVWNQPIGSVWLYRFPDEAGPSATELEALLHEAAAACVRPPT